MPLCISVDALRNNCSLWYLVELFRQGSYPMNDEFKNEVFSSYDPNPIRTCSQCDRKPAMVRSMLNPKTGRTVRMFKCECGEQTWSEDKA
jgi:hypothetical protein